MLKFLKRNQKVTPLIIKPKPNHVAVIMDGNGRWANARGLSRVAGHKKGVDAVRSVISGCLNQEIPYLSIFAFSSENWSRPKSEVDALMTLLTSTLESQTKKLNEHGIRLNLIGDLSKFDSKIQRLAQSAQQQTRHNTRLLLTVAVNYGGRWDITQAAKVLAEKVKNGELEPDQIDEAHIEQNLATYGIPDPDLLIRTSNEYRISNFFLWQSAYSEMLFTHTLWPDFDEQAFTDALLAYTKRDRRFGNASDETESCASENVDSGLEKQIK